MNKLFLSIFLFSFILFGETKAGDQWHLAAQYQYSLPAGALKAWFSPSPQSYALAAGYGDPENWMYSIRLENMLYDKPNTKELTYDDLHMQLEILGASLEGRYTLTAWSGLRPFLLWEVGLYRWRVVRGSYSINDPATGGETLVPERNQSEWSWGFSAGLGTDFLIIKNLALNAGLRYRMVVGELWPALALELENVSVFQMAVFSTGLTWYF